MVRGILKFTDIKNTVSNFFCDRHSRAFFSKDFYVIFQVFMASFNLFEKKCGDVLSCLWWGMWDYTWKFEIFSNSIPKPLDRNPLKERRYFIRVLNTPYAKNSTHVTYNKDMIYHSHILLILCSRLNFYNILRIKLNCVTDLSRQRNTFPAPECGDVKCQAESKQRVSFRSPTFRSKKN